MATAKKTSTKKKTTTKRAASAKASAKKSVSKKPASTKKNTSSTPMVTLEKLYKFNIFAAISSLGFAILSVIFLSKDSVSLFLPHSTQDELASGAGTVLGPAFTTIVTLEFRFLIAATFGLSAIFSLLLATKLRKRYEQGVKDKISTLRWVFLGINSALILAITSIFGGVNDLVTLKLVAGLILVTSVLGWMSETQNKNSEKKFTAFYLSLFTGALAWLPLVSGLVGTSIYGVQNFSWYVYLLTAVVLVGFISFAVTQYKYIKSGVNATGYLDFEGKYVSTEFLLKLAVFAIIFVALYK